MRRVKVTHPVHGGCPALHRDTLEHGQHGEPDVVEVRDAIVRTFPLFDAGALVVIAQMDPGRQFRVHGVIVIVAGRWQVTLFDDFNCTGTERNKRWFE